MKRFLLGLLIIAFVSSPIISRTETYVPIVVKADKEYMEVDSAKVRSPLTNEIVIITSKYRVGDVDSGKGDLYGCFKLVSDFYKQVYGVTVAGMHTSNPTVSKGTLDSIERNQVKPGDIIHFSNPWHWAIAREVFDNNIILLEQNYKGNKYTEAVFAREIPIASVTKVFRWSGAQDLAISPPDYSLISETTVDSQQSFGIMYAFPNPMVANAGETIVIYAETIGNVDRVVLLNEEMSKPLDKREVGKNDNSDGPGNYGGEAWHVNFEARGSAKRTLYFRAYSGEKYDEMTVELGVVGYVSNAERMQQAANQQATYGGQGAQFDANGNIIARTADGSVVMINPNAQTGWVPPGWGQTASVSSGGYVMDSPTAQNWKADGSNLVGVYDSNGTYQVIGQITDHNPTPESASSTVPDSQKQQVQYYPSLDTANHEFLLKTFGIDAAILVDSNGRPITYGEGKVVMIDRNNPTKQLYAGKSTNYYLSDYIDLPDHVQVHYDSSGNPYYTVTEPK